MSDFDPRRIVLELLDHGVDFIVIGANAALLQGVELPRTLDLDVTVAASRANLKRLAQALNSLEAMLRLGADDEPIPAPLDGRMLANMSVVTTSTRYGPLDVLMAPAGAGGYDELRRRSVEVRAYGVVVRVASLDDVVAMKRAAGREKDLAHLAAVLDFLNELDR